MKPTSPKGVDIRRDGRFALHCAFEDNQGGGGEVLVTGWVQRSTPPEDFAERGWITFHLRIAEVLSVRHPEHGHRPLFRRWTRD
jgi:hypothetical protein